MLNNQNVTKCIQSFYVAVLFCLISAASNAAPGKQVFVPVAVGDITTFIALMPAPSIVTVVEETQTVGESVHHVSWQAISNAAYYQLNITDENGDTTSVNTTSLDYSLSSLPLGVSDVVLFACNAQDNCGAAASLGEFTATERVRYAVADLLGSPILETDQAGNVISEFHYKPFGETKEEKREDIGYTGHLEDVDLGLTYMQARYYDPVLGRFMSNDPVDYLGHLQKGSGAAHGFNRYNYANNNPYRYVDPDGRSAVDKRFDEAVGSPSMGETQEEEPPTEQPGPMEEVIVTAPRAHPWTSSDELWLENTELKWELQDMFKEDTLKKLDKHFEYYANDRRRFIYIYEVGVGQHVNPDWRRLEEAKRDFGGSCNKAGICTDAWGNYTGTITP